MLKGRISIAIVLAMLLIVPTIASGQEVTLTLALRESVDTLEIYRELIKEFEEENPGISVEITNVGSTVFNENVLVQVAAGVAPDVLYVHYGFFPELARQGLLLELTPLMEKDNYGLDDFFPPTLEQLTWDGAGTYALPRETSSAVVFYNIDAFDQAGLQHPAPGWTYDDMASMARRLSRDVDGDGEQDQWGIYGFHFWYHRPNIYWSFGAEILNEDGTKFALHEPAGVAATQWMADLFVEGAATNNWANRFAAVGRSAMEIVNYWHIQQNVNNSYDWDAALLPSGPAGNVVRTATGSHGIMSVTKHPEEAWKLLKFLSSTETQLRLASSGTIIPARRSAATDPLFLDGPPANRRAFIDAIQYGRPDTVPEQVNTAMESALVSVWNGEKPANVALQELQPIVDQILREINE